MSTPDGPLDVLRSRLNIGESPAGSNCNEISEWAGLGCVAWCMEAQSFALVHGGMGDNDHGLANVGASPDYSWGWAYVPSVVNAFRAAGRFDRNPRVGDLVCFDWEGDGISDHVGMVEDVPGDGTVVTLEGNTGDDLLRKRRTFGVILGFAHLAYDGEAAPDPGHPAPSGDVLPLDVDGEFGPPQLGQRHGIYNSCKALQGAVGTEADGDWGPQTCRATQARVGTVVDGDFGPNSTKALQARVGTAADGEFGPQTAMALQRALNAGAF
ncbi:MAG: CHAP domain-containing protein [Actinomycetota bacterium]|nr:CHAP domain-containing protein [Actinomycetota bacterium]